MSIDFWRALQVLVAHKAVVRTGTRYRLAAAQGEAAWAIAHGDDARLRIVYAGYTGTVTFPETWRVARWKARGGYASQNSRGNANAARETLWLSPYCHRSSRAPLLDAALFGEATA